MTCDRQCMGRQRTRNPWPSRAAGTRQRTKAWPRYESRRAVASHSTNAMGNRTKTNGQRPELGGNAACTTTCMYAVWMLVGSLIQCALQCTRMGAADELLNALCPLAGQYALRASIRRTRKHSPPHLTTHVKRSAAAAPLLNSLIIQQMD
jgi:hypothetical protein